MNLDKLRQITIEQIAKEVEEDEMLQDFEIVAKAGWDACLQAHNEMLEMIHKGLKLTSKVYETKIQKLEKQNAKLKAQLEIAIKAVKFYADHNSWAPHRFYIEDILTISNDEEKIDELNMGGKLARETLKKLETTEK